MNAKRLMFVLITLSFFSCDKGSDKVIYDFGSGVTAEWFKQTGILDFSGATEGMYLIYEYRNNVDTLSHRAFDYFEFKVPGKHIFQLYDGNKTIGDKVIFNRMLHTGMDHICTYNTPDSPYKRYNALNDGIAGYPEFIGPEWVGWKNKDAIIEYDFMKDQNISYITINYRDEIDKGIYPPQYVLVEGSTDGINYVLKQRKNVDPPGYPVTSEQIAIRTAYQKIRITIKNYSSGDNLDSWLLVDEVMIYSN